ncbi:20S proteasome A and B subunits [Parvibaculum lavamentivorans DS-1]|uniref:20S proteasome A and B subunits n=1 Tax=Parvibaculum lavamentivorans (strain DS-1 / DSM 13023 / NCIMB 13966) TaxID=402881 RepID=A7HUH5_PARL1|nr:peptidase [Parvibaculum lavamentivorans]ABS63558.1 20S proteasome A and B subunits [Parvibaculum lavamentivorans DS-1]
MTYCVALRLKDGLVMLADTRTNAGVDNISTFRKLSTIEHPGERVIGIMTAGNLAVSQAAVNMAVEQGVRVRDGDELETLHTVPTMVRAAQLMGQAVREVYRIDGPSLEAQAGDFNVSILMGGQVGNGEMRLFQVYSAGNYIEATEDTPYLQIGEHKYGKPIIDRALSYDTALGDGLKLALISMDSTMRSNLSVGMPIDLMVYRRNALKVAMQRRIKDDDAYFTGLRHSWSDALTQAYRAIPGPGWEF